MSRSRKSTPIAKDNQNGGAKNDKRIAAHKIRNIPIDSEESETLINSPSAFKKINQDTYDIHDYICRYTEEEAREYYNKVLNNSDPGIYWSQAYRDNFLKKYPNEDIYIEKVWAKDFKRK